MGYHLSRGAERAVLVLDGAHTPEREQAFAALAGVDQVLPLSRPYRLSARELRPQDTVVQVEGLLIGRGAPCIIAGSALPAADPAAVELAVALRGAGAQVVRTGVYRPASELFGTPQLDPEALARLDGLRRASGLPVAVEVLAAED